MKLKFRLTEKIILKIESIETDEFRRECMFNILNVIYKSAFKVEDSLYIKVPRKYYKVGIKSDRTLKSLLDKLQEHNIITTDNSWFNNPNGSGIPKGYRIHHSYLGLMVEIDMKNKRLKKNILEAMKKRNLDEKEREMDAPTMSNKAFYSYAKRLKNIK